MGIPFSTNAAMVAGVVAATLYLNPLGGIGGLPPLATYALEGAAAGYVAMMIQEKGETGLGSIKPTFGALMGATGGLAAGFFDGGPLMHAAVGGAVTYVSPVVIAMLPITF